ncbi:hypothetical protein [Microbacterium panaciterrae]|uniref:hypothetical protein n=1 Tax=Microbacterium panaciterrae TaxID=985759 RepID=UPI0031E9C35A
MINDPRKMIRPSARTLMIMGMISYVPLIALSVIGAVATSQGSDLMFMRSFGSFLFWTPLVISGGFAATCSIWGFVQSVREARRGYTTIQNAYPKAEWRDVKTGLVLRKAGDPTPRGSSLAELRDRARQAQE